MAEITYRMATVEDAETLAALRWEMEVERHDASHVDQATFLATSRATLQPELAAGRYVAFLAEADGQVVACAILVSWPMLPSMQRVQRARGFVSSVYSQPAYRHQGVSRQLMQSLIAYAQQHGVHRLILWASEMGRPLYESLGFTPSRGYELNLAVNEDTDCDRPL
ncbi:MAG: GNAT family N-acetyltransferase [Ktedonobacterales bacterium]